MDEHADQPDDEQHDASETVDLESPLDVQGPGGDPGEGLVDEDFALMPEDPDEGRDAERGRTGDERRRNQVRLQLQATPEEQRDNEACQRQQRNERDDFPHGSPSPSNG